MPSPRSSVNGEVLVNHGGFGLLEGRELSPVRGAVVKAHRLDAAPAGTPQDPLTHQPAGSSRLTFLPSWRNLLSLPTNWIQSLRPKAKEPSLGRSRKAALGLFLVIAASAPSTFAAEEAADAEVAAGERIYSERCGSCHGKAGEGVKDKHPAPLVGDKSLQQLARYIEKSMPEDAPGTCAGEEARAVAAYIHGAFYSPIAQARNRPPRIEPLRLTVRQYQNTMADLIGSFREPRSAESPPFGSERGLRGEYFNARQPGRNRILDRTDAQVRFDFGRSTPHLDGLATTGFTARWTGSVIAPDTGVYEIVVRTDAAARLWVNDLERPLIDAWVKSGNEIDHPARISLLGGYPYPVKLELTSRKQGVDDSAKKKPDEKPVLTLIELCWKPPRGVLEPIPARALSPASYAPVYVVETAFPPDDRSAGYERGSSISKAWDEAATAAAIEAAGYLSRNLEALWGVSRTGTDREARVRERLSQLLERAFRRPIGEEERRLYIDRQVARAPDLETAVKRIALLAFKSPRFLLVEVEGHTPNAHPVPDSYTVASRLALALWDSCPDGRLLGAAARGALGSREHVAEEAERMLRDPRTRSKTRQFFHQWLGVDQAYDLLKDAERYPQFSEATISDLRSSLDLFLDDAVWGRRGDFRDLLLSSDLFLNGRLGAGYGADLPADASFQKVGVDRMQRAGVLSHPYVLARYAYPDASSPIHRGVFLVRSLLGRSIRPPPEAAVPLPPNLHPSLTTRERVTLQTEPKACQSCHAMINPLGFALENFDAVGRFRGEERGKPIDSRGYYETRSGTTSEFRGARELAELLAASNEVHEALISQLFHHFVKQPILAYGAETPAELGKAFQASGFSVRRLIVEIAVTAALAGHPDKGKPRLVREF